MMSKNSFDGLTPNNKIGDDSLDKIAGGIGDTVDINIIMDKIKVIPTVSNSVNGKALDPGLNNGIPREESGGLSKIKIKR